MYTFRPSTRSKVPVKVSSVCRGVGDRYETSSRPVMPGCLESDCVEPSTSSKAAAMNPPWRHPGGPS